ncbi:MAG: hypothetical protein AB8B92_11720 [Gammaproteobacteria bacterium]
MTANNTSEFILLSTLVAVLKDKDYYRTFAKTIAMTNNSEKPIASDDELVSEMFDYFIQTGLLKIYFNSKLASIESIEHEIKKRASKNIKHKDENILIRKKIWDNEVYIKIIELKKLYANKCIVFPNALLKELHKQEK